MTCIPESITWLLGKELCGGIAGSREKVILFSIVLETLGGSNQIGQNKRQFGGLWHGTPQFGGS